MKQHPSLWLSLGVGHTWLQTETQQNSVSRRKLWKGAAEFYQGSPSSSSLNRPHLHICHEQRPHGTKARVLEFRSPEPQLCI